MKRFLVFLYSFIAIFVLCACNNDIDVIQEPLEYESSNDIEEIKLDSLGKYVGEGWIFDNGTLVIEKNLSNIGIEHLWGNFKSQIIKVIINSEVTELPAGAFYNCEKLSDVQIYGKITIDRTDFNKCENLENVYIHVEENEDLANMEIDPISFRNCINAKIHFGDFTYFVERGVLIPIPTKYLDYLEIETSEENHMNNDGFVLIKVSEKGSVGVENVENIENVETVETNVETVDDLVVSNVSAKELFVLRFMNVDVAEKYAHTMFVDEYPFALGIGDYAGSFFVLNVGSDIRIDLNELIKIYDDSGLFSDEIVEEDLSSQIESSDIVDRLELIRWVENRLLRSLIDTNSNMSFSTIDYEYPIEQYIDENNYSDDENYLDEGNKNLEESILTDEENLENISEES